MLVRVGVVVIVIVVLVLVGHRSLLVGLHDAPLSPDVPEGRQQPDRPAPVAATGSLDMPLHRAATGLLRRA